MVEQVKYRSDTLSTAVAERHSVESITEILSAINDPEVPAINIMELGIVRDIQLNDSEVSITITPTYSGCPAMKVIEDEIRRVCTENGLPTVSIKTIYSPAWTTDWIPESAKEKLKNYGIAPPHMTDQSPLIQIELPNVQCPHCKSANTQLKSEFGSTACKSYYFCNTCRQAFEYFKSF